MKTPLRNSREEITLFEWDFEGDLWNSDDGWTLTESDYYRKHIVMYHQMMHLL